MFPGLIAREALLNKFASEDTLFTNQYLAFLPKGHC